MINNLVKQGCQYSGSVYQREPIVQRETECNDCSIKCFVPVGEVGVSILWGVTLVLAVVRYMYTVQITVHMYFFSFST